MDTLHHFHWEIEGLLGKYVTSNTPESRSAADFPLQHIEIQYFLIIALYVVLLSI